MKKKLTPAQRQIVEDNVGLAQFIAHRHCDRKQTAVDRDEVISAAYRGLIDAALRWSPNHPAIREGDLENGKAFSGYARQRIVGAILDQERKEDYVPNSVRGDYKKIQRSGYPKITNVRELAEASELTERRVVTVLNRIESMPVNLSDPVPSSLSKEADSSGMTLEDTTVSETASPEDNAVIKDISNSLVRGFDDLTDTQKIIIAQRYIFDKPLYRIASEDLKVPTSWVGAHHSDAIIHLLHEMQKGAEEESLESAQATVDETGEEIAFILSGLPERAVDRIFYHQSETSAWFTQAETDMLLVGAARITSRGNIRYYGSVLHHGIPQKVWYDESPGDQRKYRKAFADWLANVYDEYIGIEV